MCPRAQHQPMARACETYFANLLGRPVSLRLSAEDAMPRTAGGKHERIVSAVVA